MFGDFDVEPRRPEMAICGRDDEHEVVAGEPTFDWVVGIIDELGQAIDRLVGSDRELDREGWSHGGDVHRQPGS